MAPRLLYSRVLTELNISEEEEKKTQLDLMKRGGDMTEEEDWKEQNET